jgi:hypothetical protein
MHNPQRKSLSISGGVPLASSIRRLSRRLSRDGASQSMIGPASSVTEGLECNCRKCRKQRLPAHRSEEKLAVVMIGSVENRELRMDRKAIARETSRKSRELDERYLPVLAHWWGRCTSTSST